MLCWIRCTQDANPQSDLLSVGKLLLTKSCTVCSALAAKTLCQVGSQQLSLRPAAGQSTAARIYADISWLPLDRSPGLRGVSLNVKLLACSADCFITDPVLAHRRNLGATP